MEEDQESFYQQLLKVDELDGQNAWGTFLFNVPLARSLGGISAEEATVLLQAGCKWAGNGWTTSRASRALHSLTGIPLVASTVAAYRDAWLYALSMAFNV